MSDLNDLFAKDPLELTDDHIDKLIAEYRKQRAQFLTGGGQTAKPRAKKEPAPQLDLDSLDL